MRVVLFPVESFSAELQFEVDRKSFKRDPKSLHKYMYGIGVAFIEQLMKKLPLTILLKLSVDQLLLVYGTQQHYS